MDYFIDQKNFFKKLNFEKYKDFENNLCGLINIYIILKNLGINISEINIFNYALKINAYDKRYGWIYIKLIELLKYYFDKNNTKYKKIEIFDTKFFHKSKLKYVFKNLSNFFFIASIKLDENHLIIIDKVSQTQVFYVSVGTKENKCVEKGVMSYKDFFEIYNKRGIIVDLSN